MKLDRAAAERQLANLAAALGTSTKDAAAGIYRAVGRIDDGGGAGARGRPRRRLSRASLFCLRRGWPVHACYVAELLESPVVIYPPLASVLSAFGTLVTPPRLDLGARSRACRRSMAARRCGLSPARRRRHGWPRRRRLPGRRHRLPLRRRHALLRPAERGHRLVRCRSARPARPGVDPRDLRGRVRRLYSMRLDVDVEVELAPDRHGRSASRDSAPSSAPAPRGRRPPARPASTAATSTRRCTAGACWPKVSTIAGPAIIEERETTIVILPGWREGRPDRMHMASRE